jgi:predicted nucleic acid-binding protein
MDSAMSKPAVVDAGPLVAILRKEDEHHRACVVALRESATHLYTCWPVITEAAWLLRHDHGGVEGLFRVFQSGAITVAELDRESLLWIPLFLARYASNRAQVADAAVMYLAERYDTETVLTLDRRDFSVYRRTNGKALTLLPSH